MSAPQPHTTARAMAALLACAALGGCAAPVRGDGPLEPLLERVVERNAIGDEVALSKWDSGRPVLDAAREAAVLASVREQARGHGLDADGAARFIAAQIESNKLVQYQLLDRWRLRGRAPQRPRPDLGALRVRLDRLQDEMLDALQRSAALRDAADCPARTADAAHAYAQRRRLDPVHRTALVRGLGDFCR